MRMAREIALGHQVNMAEHVAELSKRENTVISFTDDEALRLIHPHTDALVVTLSVANGKVFHILIDTESSVDILFVSAFRYMNVGEATTRPIKTLLYGFGGEGFTPKGPSSYLLLSTHTQLKSLKWLTFCW